MTDPALSVREIQESDIHHITNYWLTADVGYLKRLGVDESKIPTREELTQMLMEQIDVGYEEKKSYCLIWLINNVPSGHSNINKIVYGEEAYMHLHLWNNAARQQGLGSAFIKLTLPYYFSNYKLQKLYCEPYALNPAPNKTLAKAGFDFVKQHVTIPGSLNFEQQVNLWEITFDKYNLLTHKM
jgi:RimJ/RimL family protein N-acetyltransferase